MLVRAAPALPSGPTAASCLRPKPRDYSYVLNKKVKRLALKSVLSAKASEGNI
jgi:ribosomal protein L4